MHELFGVQVLRLKGKITKIISNCRVTDTLFTSLVREQVKDALAIYLM